MILFQSIGKILKIWIMLVMMFEVNLCSSGKPVIRHLGWPIPQQFGGGKQAVDSSKAAGSSGKSNKGVPKVDLSQVIEAAKEPFSDDLQKKQVGSIPLAGGSSVAVQIFQLPEQANAQSVPKGARPQPPLDPQPKVIVEKPAAGGAAAPQKYEHKPVEIPVVDNKETGKADNILDAFELQYNPRGWLSNASLVNKSDSSIVRSEFASNRIESFLEKYKKKYSDKNEIELFIQLQQDMQDFKTKAKSAGSSYEKVNQALKNVSAELSKEIKIIGIEKLNKTIASAQDVSLSSLVKNFTNDQNMIQEQISKNNQLSANEKLIYNEYLQMYDQVIQELNKATNLASRIIDKDIEKNFKAWQSKQGNDQKTSQDYVTSEDFKNIVSISLKDSDHIKDVQGSQNFIIAQATKQIVQSLDAKLSESDKQSLITSKAHNAASSLWKDYLKPQSEKDKKIKALVREQLAEEPLKSKLTEEQKKRLLENHAISLDDISRLKDELVDRDHEKVLENLEQDIQKLQDDNVIKQAFAEFKSALVSEIINKENLSENSKKALETYKSNHQKAGNIVDFPEKYKDAFGKMEEIELNYGHSDDNQKINGVENPDFINPLIERFKNLPDIKLADIVNQYIQTIKLLDKKKHVDGLIREQGSTLGQKLWSNHTLNTASQALLNKKITDLQNPKPFNLEAEKKEFKKIFNQLTPDQVKNAFKDVKTAEHCIALYESIIKVYHEESWIGGFLRRINTALDSMANKSYGRAVRDVSIAVGTGVVYVPMASVEAFNILSSSVDGYFAATFKIDINGPKYKAFKFAISVKILVPAAAALTAINSSNMTIEQKTQAKHDVLSAVFADTVNYAAASSLGVSTDVLKSGDAQYIAETALLNQMMNSLNGSTGNDYDFDGHAASNTANLDAAMSKYHSYLNPDATTSYGSGAYAA